MHDLLAGEPFGNACADTRLIEFELVDVVALESAAEAIDRMHRFVHIVAREQQHLVIRIDDDGAAGASGLARGLRIEQACAKLRQPQADGATSLHADVHNA